MKIAVVGSRGVDNIKLEEYIPSECEEIVSGGARGVDALAAEYARKNGLKLTEFIPQYEKYGRGAPLVRNREIVEYSELVLAFWDGSSAGTLYVINYCKKIGKPIKVITL